MNELSMKQDLIKQLIEMMREKEVEGFKGRKKPKEVVVEEISIEEPVKEEGKLDVPGIEELAEAERSGECEDEEEMDDEDEEY